MYLLGLMFIVHLPLFLILLPRSSYWDVYQRKKEIKMDLETILMK